MYAGCMIRVLQLGLIPLVACGAPKPPVLGSCRVLVHQHMAADDAARRAARSALSNTPGQRVTGVSMHPLPGLASYFIFTMKSRFRPAEQKNFRRI